MLIQNDAIKMGVDRDILATFEKEGFHSILMRQIERVGRKMALAHYLDSDEQLKGMGKKTELAMSPAELQSLFGTLDPVEIGRTLHSWLKESTADKPVIAVVYGAEDVMARIRKLVGYTDPSKADKGTIRVIMEMTR